MPAWRRVRDTTTGHQYDIPAGQPLVDGVEAVKGAEVISGPGARPRPTKPRVPLGAKPPRAERGTRTRDTTTDAPDVPANSKE